MFILNISIKKLQNWLFYLLIFLLPSNLGYHLILPSSYVQGILIDYLIPTVYLTDIVIFFLFATWFLEKKDKITKIQIPITKQLSNFKITISKQIINFKLKFSKQIIWVLIGLFFILINILVAKNRAAAGYKWVKIAEVGLLFLWIRSHLHLGGILRQAQDTIRGAITLSVLWQSGLAIAQWIKQGNIFPYFIMGESQFSAAAANIKTINWFGAEKVVPMGTFPHPNVLAAWLVLILIFLFLTFPKQKKPVFLTDDRHTKKQDIFDSIWVNMLGKLGNWYFYLLILFLAAAALFFTFSLPAWGVFILLILKMSQESFFKTQRDRQIKNKKALNSKLDLVILAGGAVIVLFWGLNTFGDPHSWFRRWELTKIAWQMWLSSPLLGVGLNNFTVRMSEFGEIAGNIRFLQPVHNVPLLILAETGMIGLGALGYGLIASLKSIKSLRSLKNLISSPGFFRRLDRECSAIAPAYILGTIFFLSLFDHYFLTTQQGMLMVILFLSLGDRIDLL